MELLLVAVSAYLIGAVPFAYLVVRLLTGRDIRKIGTGNVGVMNTVRQVGLPAGIIVFVAEGLKGVVSVTLGREIAGVSGELLAAFCALAGINWSVFVGFAGGRGTTVSLFALVQIDYRAFLILAAVWFTLYAVRHNNFVSTRAVILLLPVTAIILRPDDLRYLICGLGMAAILLIRHRRDTDDHLIAVTQPVASSETTDLSR